MSTVAQAELEMETLRETLEHSMRRRKYGAVFVHARKVIEQICKHEVPEVTGDEGIEMRLQVMRKTIPAPIWASIRYAYSMTSWGIHEPEPHQGTPQESDVRLTLTHLALILAWFAERTRSGVLKAMAAQLKRDEYQKRFHFSSAPIWGVDIKHSLWLQGTGEFLCIDRRGNEGTPFPFAERAAAVASADDDSLWVSSFSGVLHKLHGTEQTKIATVSPVLCLASCGRLMLGGDARGVTALQPPGKHRALPAPAIQIHAISSTHALVLDTLGDVHVTAWPEGDLHYSFSASERRAGVRMLQADVEGSRSIICVGRDDVWRVDVPRALGESAGVRRTSERPCATLPGDVRTVVPLGYLDHLVVLTTDNQMYVVDDEMQVTRPIVLPRPNVAVRGLVYRGHGHGAAFWTSAGELGLLPAEAQPRPQVFEGDFALLVASRVKPEQIFGIQWRPEDSALWYETNVVARY
jgi:hypothetical protein